VKELDATYLIYNFCHYSFVCPSLSEMSKYMVRSTLCAVWFHCYIEHCAVGSPIWSRLPRVCGLLFGRHHVLLSSDRTIGHPSVSLTIYLRRQGFFWPVVSWRRSDSMIVKLMQYVVCSGVATAYESPFLCLSVYCIIDCHVCNSACTLAILIAVSRAGKLGWFSSANFAICATQVSINAESVVWTAFYYLLSKCACCSSLQYTLNPRLNWSSTSYAVYVNCFLALYVVGYLFFYWLLNFTHRNCSLNARQTLRRRIDERKLSLEPLSDVRFAVSKPGATHGTLQSTASNNSNDVKVRIHLTCTICISREIVEKDRRSLVILNGAPSREELAEDKKLGTSTSLTVWYTAMQKRLSNLLLVNLGRKRTKKCSNYTRSWRVWQRPIRFTKRVMINFRVQLIIVRAAFALPWAMVKDITYIYTLHNLKRAGE
jgi:hypothetical protein